jgi:hypothetical protein
MRFYIFKGNSDSSDYETRLGFIRDIEAPSWRSALSSIWSMRSSQSEDWQTELECGIDWEKKPFVLLIKRRCQKMGIPIPSGEEEINETLQRSFVFNPSQERFCRKVVRAMNLEMDDIDKFLIVEETKSSLDLLNYLGVVPEHTAKIKRLKKKRSSQPKEKSPLERRLSEERSDLQPKEKSADPPKE